MKLKSVIYLLMEKMLSPCTDKIVCISKAEKLSAECEHIAKDDKLALIPNGIDVNAVRNAICCLVGKVLAWLLWSIWLQRRMWWLRELMLFLL